MGKDDHQTPEETVEDDTEDEDDDDDFNNEAKDEAKDDDEVDDARKSRGGSRPGSRSKGSGDDDEDDDDEEAAAELARIEAELLRKEELAKKLADKAKVGDFCMHAKYTNNRVQWIDTHLFVITSIISCSNKLT